MRTHFTIALNLILITCVCNQIALGQGKPKHAPLSTGQAWATTGDLMVATSADSFTEMHNARRSEQFDLTVNLVKTGKVLMIGEGLTLVVVQPGKTKTDESMECYLRKDGKPYLAKDGQPVGRVWVWEPFFDTDSKLLKRDPASDYLFKKEQ